MKTILVALGLLAVTPAAARATTVAHAPDSALVVTAGAGESNRIDIQERDGDDWGDISTGLRVSLSSGPGRDRISGDERSGGCGPVWCDLPFGNETIYAQDGEPDSIGCGYGEDTVYADAVDVVASDFEHVTRGGAPSGGGGGGGGPATPPPARHTPRVLSLKIRGRTLRVRARDAAKVRVSVRHGRTRTAAVNHGRATVALGRLPHGRHQLTVTPLGVHGERGRARALGFRVFAPR